MAVQRRLAAILAADVAGYSRLMGEDEEGTLAALTAHRTELIEPCISEYRGRVVNTAGDGLLAEFASVVDAVRCAVAFQKGMTKRNADTSGERHIEFRIGVNLGDVIVQDDDIFGDGVNIAARLESLAEPGAICVSDSVHQNIRSKLELSFDDLGPQRVKNIGDPVHAFHLRPGARAEPEQAEEDAPPLPKKPSIAVLPFENMSADPEQEFFSDGITEDIITELSKISGLFVIARHSAFTYKGKSVTLKQVGQELGVRYALEGSVRKAGDRLRITAQLIDTATDHHLWAERYDRSIEDIFAVQDEVAQHVADALRVALTEDERELLAHAPTDNLEAYELYRRARSVTWPPTYANVHRARNAYSHVIEVEPQFAGGYAGKSLSHSMAVVFGHSDTPEADAQTAMDLAERAVALDEEFAIAHSALGVAHTSAGRHQEAVAAARRAVEIQPGDADVHAFLARCLMWGGVNVKAAIVEAETAHRLDPQYVEGPYLNLLGRAYVGNRQYELAINAFERNAARGGPLAVVLVLHWAAACAFVGRIDDAKDLLEQVLRESPGFSLSKIQSVKETLTDEELVLLTEGLQKAGLPE